MLKVVTHKISAIILTILTASFLIYLLQTTNNQPPKVVTKNPRLQIVTSFYPLYFFTTQIVQDKADVHNVTPAGAEPHDYEPTIKDITNIENSQLLIINGNKFEAWAENIINIIDGKTLTIINMGESLAKQNLIEKNIQTRDPHFWLSPKLAKHEIEIILQNLITIDPVNFQYYNDNSKLLLDKLSSLNNQFKIGLSNCQKKEIVTSHAAFGYLASDYGLNQTAISGLSPDEEPSPKKIAEIANFAKNKQIRYIFFESLISPKLADTIAKEIGAKTLLLNPIEGITEEDIKNGKTYFTEMQNNLINLKIALQCQ